MPQEVRTCQLAAFIHRNFVIRTGPLWVRQYVDGHQPLGPRSRGQAARLLQLGWGCRHFGVGQHPLPEEV